MDDKKRRFNARVRGKRGEAKVAKFFGTHRTPLSGGNSRITTSDTLHPHIYIESKHYGVRRVPALIGEWYGAQYNRVKGGHKNDVVILRVYVPKLDELLVFVRDDHLRLAAMNSNAHLYYRKLGSYHGLTIFNDIMKRAHLEKKVPLLSMDPGGRQGRFFAFRAADFDEICEEVRIAEEKSNGVSVSRE